ncbi:MAG: polyprenyl synthetase family protein [Hyphomicrobium sp.]
MDATSRIENALDAVLQRMEVSGSPPRLAAAARYAVFPGGARVRPRLCLAVAGACGDDAPAVADCAAASIELLHCASLVHDDLPCFDNAATRRGKPSVHAVYGEASAVLVGDALIVAAYEALAHGVATLPARLPGLLMTIGRAAGMPAGIVAGQAWESEDHVSLPDYHRSKTGALFAAATVAGALAAGDRPDRWRRLGECVGEAYQVADDIQDLIADPATLGKPCGQDVAHSRPSATRELGLDGAVRRLEGLLAEAIESIPDCHGAGELRGIIMAQAKRFVPKGLARSAA